MNTKAAIVTVPNRETLMRCRESIIAAGWSDIEIIVDDDCQGQNMTQFLRAVAAGARTIFEDDALVAMNLREYLLDSIKEWWDIAVMYTNSPDDQFLETGWHEYTPVVARAGGLGYWLSDRVAKMLLADPPRETDKADLTLCRWASTRDVRMVIHEPSLIFHLGRKSTFNDRSFTRSRQCRRWLPDALIDQWLDIDWQQSEPAGV